MPAGMVRPDAAEIVVTGERVARTRRETASSVVVQTAGSIATLAEPDRIDQLLQLVPNVQLGSGGEAPTIRGQDATGVVRDLPAFLGGIRPRLSLQVDGRAISYYELAFGLTSIWDVERVEVFRSPQTTTQGRNSIAGAIFVETRAPSDQWEGRVRLIGGNFATEQASAAVSGPLFDGQLAFRLAGDLRRSRTSSEITDAARGIDANRDDSELLRFKLTAKPDAIPGTRLDLTYVHGHSQMPQIEGVEEPFEQRRNPNATYGIFAITTDALTAKLNYAASAALSATTKLSYGDARVRRYAPAGLGEAQIRSKDFSIEPLLHWKPGGAVQLTGGLHYLRSTLHQTIDVSAQGFGLGTFDDLQHSLGLFGEATVKLTPRFTAIAGLRYQQDRQERRGAMVGGPAPLPLDYIGRFHAWLPKLSLAYDLSPQLRLGVLAQRAYNPGGVTINTQRFRSDTFEDEQLWDFELFARARLAGGKLTLAANIFHYAMTDAQRPQTIAFALPDGTLAFASEVDNAPRAWTNGAEFELAWNPSPAFSIQTAFGLLDTRITQTLVTSDPLLGKQFQRSPRFTASGAVVWKPASPITLSAQLRHNSAYFSDDIETASRRIDGSTTLDARAAWSQGGVTLFGYVRNLFDEFHLTYRFPVQTGLATAGDPREFGLGMESKF